MGHRFPRTNRTHSYFENNVSIGVCVEMPTANYCYHLPSFCSSLIHDGFQGRSNWSCWSRCHMEACVQWYSGTSPYSLLLLIQTQELHIASLCTFVLTLLSFSHGRTTMAGYCKTSYCGCTEAISYELGVFQTSCF